MKFSTFDIGTLRDFANVYYSNGSGIEYIMNKLYPDDFGKFYDYEFHIDICFVI